jgi:hypothetical protein
LDHQIILFLSASPGDLQVHALESELSRARRATLIEEGNVESIENSDKLEEEGLMEYAQKCQAVYAENVLILFTDPSRTFGTF